MVDVRKKCKIVWRGKVCGAINALASKKIYRKNAALFYGNKTLFWYGYSESKRRAARLFLRRAFGIRKNELKGYDYVIRMVKARVINNK